MCQTTNMNDRQTNTTQHIKQETVSLNNRCTCRTEHEPSKLSATLSFTAHQSLCSTAASLWHSAVYIYAQHQALQPSGLHRSPSPLHITTNASPELQHIRLACSRDRLPNALAECGLLTHAIVTRGHFGNTTLETNLNSSKSLSWAPHRTEIHSSRQNVSIAVMRQPVSRF